MISSKNEKVHGKETSKVDMVSFITTKFRNLLKKWTFISDASSSTIARDNLTEDNSEPDIESLSRVRNGVKADVSTGKMVLGGRNDFIMVAAELEKIVQQPLDYLISIPGKDIRGKLISAFNEWLKLPEEKLAIVRPIINSLHTASLLIDDIQDGSRLRRGYPVAHDIFGVAQTINSANYAYFVQQKRLSDIGSPAAFEIFTRSLLDLHLGQGMDLYWRDAVICPTEEEYTRMVVYKTGGLFSLAVGLMQVQTDIKTDFSALVELLGIIFQIRDDYMNLCSGFYAEQKGAMEDLTEGKFSYPIIHSIRAIPGNTELLEILKQRTEDKNIKMRAVHLIESTGSFQHCRQTLSRLTEQACQCVEELEIELGPNDGIHRIIDLLHVESPDERQY